MSAHNDRLRAELANKIADAVINVQAARHNLEAAIGNLDRLTEELQLLNALGRREDDPRILDEN